MRLRDLELQKIYSSENDDILNDFYNPALECAVKYDRITGFFSPKVFALAARGFRKCIQNNCKIRIITSVELEPEVYDSLTDDGANSVLENKINEFDPDLLLDDLQYNYLKLFLYLYNTGQLELKIALVEKNIGIMHEKIGVIYDNTGDAVAFSGSNNETASGWVNNIEEFLVFNNWDELSFEYFSNRINKFDNYWTGNTKRFKVISLNDVQKEKLVKKTNSDELTKEELLEKIKELEKEDGTKDGEPVKPRELREYQLDAIQHWEDESYVSIFSMATGTGKTFTALNALRRFHEQEGSLHCIIAVPLVSLVQQWEEEVRGMFPTFTIISASSKVNPHWKNDFENLSINASFGAIPNYVIITTYTTLATEYFGNTIKSIASDNILVADEMHNLVVENRKRIKAIDVDYYPYKLGLSATPTRLWNPDDSEYVSRLFGNNPYVYSLEKAIQNGYLVPYYYHPVHIALTGDEYDEYIRLSREIAKYSFASSAKDDDITKDKYKTLLLQRADIKKNAENKTLRLCSLLGDIKKNEKLERALIYVDDKERLEHTQRALTELMIKTARFTGDEDMSTRSSVIQGLRNKQHDAIIAIKCLDEGVDIPSAKMAFLVSSSTDPREYIQRLGRILRLDKEGNKQYAIVYDFIVTPPENIIYESESDRTIARNLLKNELIRAKFFINLSVNSEEAQVEVDDIANNYLFNFSEEELSYNINKESEV